MTSSEFETPEIDKYSYRQTNIGNIGIGTHIGTKNIGDIYMLRPDSVTAQFIYWAAACPVNVLGRCIFAQFMKWASDSLEQKYKKDINFWLGQANSIN